MTRVVILGAGPAGLGAAWLLAKSGKASVTVVERNEFVGGNAASFEVDGHRLDFGSHRLHPACDPRILADIRRFLGAELLDRPRFGRIRLRNRWLRFPLAPVDLATHAPFGFVTGVLRDAAARTLTRNEITAAQPTFASVLRASLGRTICDEFYFPYARKIWGRDPEELSPIQAKKRVSASGFLKLARKIASAVPGLKRPGAGRFYYPCRGFGQISEAYAGAARQAGAEILLGRTARSARPPAGNSEPWRLKIGDDDAATEVDADHLWSTIPISALAGIMRSDVPPAVTEAARSIQYRAMVLAYVELPVDRFSAFDAHYFPGADVAMTRMSEPKNYAVRTSPAGRTVLCAELPCDVGDAIWNAPDEDLGSTVASDLDRCGIPFPAEPIRIFTRRLPQAYPIYLIGYEEPFGVLDRWAASLPRALSYGRQGLFAHDNTHHALAMAYAAAECLQPTGDFDHAAWRDHRRRFEEHVVED